MDRKQALEKLNECKRCGDVEVAHLNADLVLCDLLDKLGYSDVVKQWYLVDKWYA